MPTNALGREIPEELGGRPLRPYQGAFVTVPAGRRVYFRFLFNSFS